MKYLFSLTLTIAFSFCCLAQSFRYEYEGQTLIYYINNEEEKTCRVQSSVSGINEIVGDLVIPRVVTYKNQEYVVTEIYNNCFEYNKKLSSVVIPSSVTSVGENAFTGCSELIKIAYPDTIENPFIDSEDGVTISYDASSYFEEDGYVFNKQKSEIYFAPLSLSGNYSVPESVVSIGSLAFYGCRSMTAVNIPRSVNNIGKNAFALCYSLSSINVDSNNSKYLSIDGVLIDKSLSELLLFPCGKSGAYKIPDNIVSIGPSAFRNCRGVTSVLIPASVESIGEYAFLWCLNLTSLTVEESNSVYSSLDGVLFSKDKTELIQYPNGKIGEYTVPELVITIKYGAFAISQGLAKVSIGNSVEFIEDYAFYSCECLKSVNLGPKVKTIGEYSFAYCTDLQTINLPASLTELKEGVFCKCNLLKSISLPDSLTTIAEETFYGCEALNSIVIPSGVTSIGEAAFYKCGSLIYIEIPQAVTSIGDYAFNRCKSLSSIVIPKSVTSIGLYAFYNCISLKKIEMDNKVTKIDDYAFASCPALTSVYYSAEYLVSGNSNIFDTDTYNKCVLYLNEKAVNSAKNIDPWKNFNNVEAYDFSGVKDVYNDIDLCLPYKVYDLNGAFIGNTITDIEDGIYIIRQGTTAKKIIIN